MSKSIFPLLIAQFLSAFADNTIMFTVIAMVMHIEQLPSWYIPALQSVFLIAFVLLAPWVGSFADTHPKSRVLIVANLIKAIGAGLLLIKVEPLIAYCIVGIGAAIYSPAKYGILPELSEPDSLIKANSWIEGSTILAIITGMLAGSALADESIELSLYASIAFLALSALFTLFLPKSPATKRNSKVGILRQFYLEISSFFQQAPARFAVLGGALFWSTAACVRVILIAWAPLVLMSQNSSDIAQLTVFLAVGIVIGAALTPKLIPLHKISRCKIPAYLMGLTIIALSFTSAVWLARVTLFILGAAGGIFIVPINSTLQNIGQNSIGSGGAVAMQNFFQNLAMLSSVGLYTLAAAQHIHPVTAFMTLGLIVILATSVLMKKPSAIDQ